MPSPGEDIQSWSVTATNNGTADPLIDWHEGQTRASVNNSSRSEMAAHAKNRNLLNGSIVTTGAANAQAFLSGVGYTSIPTGLVVKLKVGSGLTNTASTTLNMDGIGDVLVKTANGENLRGGEFVGNTYVDLLSNGTNWVFLYSQQFIDDQLHGGGGVIIGQRKYTTPGSFSYTPTAGTECAIIECIGGGGAGGVGHNDGPPAFLCQGGGGGSGGYSRKLATAADIGAGLSVIVGAGGASNGVSGGQSSVGSICVANGGLGGPNNNYTNFGGGGAGGAPGVGDITAAGAPGEGGTYLLFNASLGQQFDCSTGGGGSSIYGGGATPVLVGYSGGPSHGNAARNYGSGGGGGASGLYGSPGNGGAGSSGIVIITEFAGRGAPGHDGAAGAVGPIGPAGPAGAGTGDVLVSGTPAAGQIAQWTDTSHIQGAVSAAAIGASRVLLDARTFSAAATVDFGTSGNPPINNVYDQYEFVITDLWCSVDAQALAVRVSTDGGATWKSGAGDYKRIIKYTKYSTATTTISPATENALYFATQLSASTSHNLSGVLRLHAPANASVHQFRGIFSNYRSDADLVLQESAGAYLAAVPINAVRFLASGGTISGKIAMYGLK